MTVCVKSKDALGDAGDAETRFPGGCVVNATQQPEREERWSLERARAQRGRVRGKELQMLSRTSRARGRFKECILQRFIM